MREAASAEAGRELSWSVQLNGEALQPVRAASADCFDAYADATEEAPPPGLYAPASTDGWWLLLPPLPAGRHELVVEARPAGAGKVRGRHDQQFSLVLDVGGESAEASADDDATPGPKPDLITL